MSVVHGSETSEEITERGATTGRRRARWLVAAVAAVVAVVAVAGVWALVSSGDDAEPVGSDVSRSTGAPASTAAPSSSSAPQVTVPAGCAASPAPTLSADDVVATPMVVSSLVVLFPPECQQQIPADGQGLATVPVTLRTQSDVLVLGDAGGATRSSYTVSALDPATGRLSLVSSGDVLASDTAFGATTLVPAPSVAPTATAAIPVPDEPCVVVGVQWSTADVVAEFVALVETGDVTCPPF